MQATHYNGHAWESDNRKVDIIYADRQAQNMKDNPMIVDVKAIQQNAADDAT